MKSILLTLTLFSLQAAANNAVYSVPSPDAGDASSNSTNATLANDTGVVTLSYQLPEDLVGPGAKPITMHLESRLMSPQGPILKFKSQDGWSVCLTQAAGLACTSDYDHATLNPQQIADFLTLKYASQPDVLSAKLSALKSFSTDPIGVLQITCSAPGCGL